jgi:hypothetical protein
MTRATLPFLHAGGTGSSFHGSHVGVIDIGSRIQTEGGLDVGSMTKLINGGHAHFIVSPYTDINGTDGLGLVKHKEGFLLANVFGIHFLIVVFHLFG